MPIAYLRVVIVVDMCSTVWFLRAKAATAFSAS